MGVTDLEAGQQAGPELPEQGPLGQGVVDHPEVGAGRGPTGTDRLPWPSSRSAWLASWPPFYPVGPSWLTGARSQPSAPSTTARASAVIERAPGRNDERHVHPHLDQGRRRTRLAGARQEGGAVSGGVLLGERGGARPGREGELLGRRQGRGVGRELGPLSGLQHPGHIDREQTTGRRPARGSPPTSTVTEPRSEADLDGDIEVDGAGPGRAVTEPPLTKTPGAWWPSSRAGRMPGTASRRGAPRRGRRRRPRR